MTDQGGNSIAMREYRKGNWNVNETMVLVTARKMDDERRMKKSGDSEGRGKPTELRWKWVEDYCWRRGCLRSQNQCNDKWDNLMRDYKKVREYQRRTAEREEGNNSNEGSYWEMEKNERKEKNLPSNMLRQIYERLEEVVEKKGGQRVVSASASGSFPIPNIPYVMDRPITSVQPSLPPLWQHQLPPIPAAFPLPLTAPPQLPQPPTAAPTPLLQPPLSNAQPFPTVDSDTSEHSNSLAKRRRRSGGNGVGTSGGTASPNNLNEVGTAIYKSVSIISEGIQACEENEERRHKDLVSLHERRLKVEESKTEINKRGIDSLVDAINKLSNSILALASHKNQSAPK